MVSELSRTLLKYRGQPVIAAHIETFHTVEGWRVAWDISAAAVMVYDRFMYNFGNPPILPIFCHFNYRGQVESTPSCEVG